MKLYSRHCTQQDILSIIIGTFLTAVFRFATTMMETGDSTCHPKILPWPSLTADPLALKSATTDRLVSVTLPASHENGKMEFIW